MSDGKSKWDAHIARLMVTALAAKKMRAHQHKVLVYGGFALLIWIAFIILVARVFGYTPNDLEALVLSGALFLGGGTIIYALLRKASFSLACPACGRDVNLNCRWTCGWCGHRNDDFVYGVAAPCVIEKCSSAGCGRDANAILCPHCGEDIVLDRSPYNQEQEYGTVRPGRAKLLARRG